MSKHKHNTKLVTLYIFVFAILLVIHRSVVQVRRVQESSFHGREESGTVPIITSTVPVKGETGRRSSHHLLHPSPKNSFRTTAVYTIPSVLAPYADIIYSSDTVQLQHCLSQSQQPWPASLWQKFIEWSSPILLKHRLNGHFAHHLDLKEAPNSTVRPYRVKDEFTMQLLEIFISTHSESQQHHHHGLCNYTNYRFHRIHDTDRNKRQSFQQAEEQLQEHLHHSQQLHQYHDQDDDDSRATGGSSTDTDTDTAMAKIVFQIVAYQDATHLQRLVQSLWMPQHFFLVHIEKYAEPDFQQAVHNIAKRYSNVVVLQFGNVVYETDSVSQINLEIMEWLIMTLPSDESTFDYLVTLGGAAFPLWNATALSQHLYQAKHQQGRHVWMGELLHSSQRVHHPQAMLVWNRKRLYTSSENGEKISWRLGNIVTTPVPQWMNRSMHHKSTSGNQAIYSLDVVKRIMENPHVRQLFALAKYGCCCCLEERTWIAAMDMLGLLQEAKENYGMFQLWGAPADSNAGVTASTSAPCQGGMRNSVLEINVYSHSCYRSEHANDVKGTSSMMNATGVWNKLVEGKANGILFARKFHSGNDRSMQMLRKIVHELH